MFKRFTVTFGEPLDLSDLHGTKGAVEKATDRLTERLAEMLGQPVPVGKPEPRDAVAAAPPRRTGDCPLDTRPASV